MVPEPKKICLVDDHVLMADGIRSLLDEEEDFVVVEHFTNGLAAVEQLPEIQPDLVLMDLDMPIMNGLEAAQQLRAKLPDLPIIILSMHAEKAVVQKCVKEGVRGYLLKNSSQTEVIQAIRAVLNGGKYYSAMLTESLIAPDKVAVEGNASVRLLATLSDRELDVLKLLAEGLSSKEIAEKLFVSSQTVDSHRKSLLKKLEVKNVAGLVRVAFQEGLVK